MNSKVAHGVISFDGSCYGIPTMNNQMISPRGPPCASSCTSCIIYVANAVVHKTNSKVVHGVISFDGSYYGIPTMNNQMISPCGPPCGSSCYIMHYLRCKCST